MSSHLITDYIRIKVNDIFDELKEENKRLNNELMFANNCLKVLLKLKSFNEKICIKFETIIESEDKQELIQLREEFISVIKCEKQKVNQNSTENKKLNEITDENINNNFTEDINEENIDFLRDKQKLSPLKTTHKPEEGLNIKVSNNGKRKLYVCPKPECLKRFRNKYYIKEHIRSQHSEKRTFICDHKNCNMRFSTIKGLETHSNIHSNIKCFKCNDCQKSFKRKCDLNRHILTVHLKEKKYVCLHTNCNKRFKGINGLNYHLSTHSEIKPFVCPLEGCGHRFTNSILLKTHSLVHSDIRSYKCNECEMTFKRKGGLKAHELLHKSGATIKCSHKECNEMFNSYTTLWKHRIDVHKYEPKRRVGMHCCLWPGCDFKTLYLNHLVTHNYSHTGERPFACHWPQCEQRFKSTKELKRHVLIHSDIKPFVCEWPECGKRFLRSDKLKEHKLIHTNSKPLVCNYPECQFRTRFSAHLSLHKKSHQN